MQNSNVDWGKRRSTFIWVGLFFGVFVLFYNLGGRSFENRDYLRFAEVSREILETGDWVMMRLGGEIYVHKPPLHFWNTAISFKLFGIGTFSARFPSAFFAIIGFLVTMIFGIRVNSGNQKAGIYAALFLVSNYAYFFYSRTMRLDIELSVLFSLSLISFYVGHEAVERKQKIMFYLMFWIFMGMAALVKGPVVLIEFVIIALYLFMSRKKRKAGGWLIAATFPAFLATVLPWMVSLFFHKDYDLFLEIFKQTRILTREGGFFYYVSAFIGHMFPMSVFVLIALPLMWRWKEKIRENSGLIFCLIWVAVYAVVAQLTYVKHFRYLLPMAVPLAIIAGWGADQIRNTIIKGQYDRKYWKVIGAILAGFVCIGPSIWIWISRGWMWTAFILSATGILFVVITWRKTRDAVIMICILYSLWLLAGDINRTSFNTERSGNQAIYTTLRELEIKAGDLVLYGTDSGLKRALYFYYRSPVRQYDSISKIDENVMAIVTTPQEQDHVEKVYRSGGRNIAKERHENGKGDTYYLLFKLRNDESMLHGTVQTSLHFLNPPGL